MLGEGLGPADANYYMLLFVVYAKLRLTHWDSMDCNPPGYPAHGFMQERILEWVAMPSPRGSSPPRDQTHVSYIADKFFII